jgi:riboflavin synthase
MFTGIVTDRGEVRHIKKRGDTHVVIATHYDVAAIDVGASVACSGICMTVVDKGGGKDRWFAVTASGETLSKTTVKIWKVGYPINLERPLRIGDELGGHIVTGHVDDVGVVVSSKPEGESIRISIEVPEKLRRFIAPKGSIAVDGVSLTVNEVDQFGFGVNLIPHTLATTTFGDITEGMIVNLEVDLMARYVARLANSR